MDNGFLLLNKIKIPHVNMLAKFSSVDLKTNKYVRPRSAALVYGMTHIAFPSSLATDADDT